MKLIFFDTEFNDLCIDPKLISIGLVSDDGGRSFYAELMDTYLPEDCSYFVEETVLPLLEGGDACMEMHHLILRLGNWIEDFEEPVMLATDSEAWDWTWIQKIFQIPGTWPANLAPKPFLLHAQRQDDQDAFEEGLEAAFAGGLRRHHALDDARANRVAWAAMNDNKNNGAVNEQCKNPPNNPSFT